MIRRGTWIVLAVFVALLAGLLFWQSKGSPTIGGDETPTPEERANLFDFAPESLQTVKLERSGERAVAFQRSGSTWQIAQPPDLPGDSTAIESTLAQLVAVTGQPLKNVPAMEAMGLSKPKYRLEVTLQDGSQQIVYVGNTTPTGDGYYAMNSQQQVQVVNSYSLDPILGLIDNPPLLSTPTPAEAYPFPESTAGPASTEAAPVGTP